VSQARQIRAPAGPTTALAPQTGHSPRSSSENQERASTSGGSRLTLSRLGRRFIAGIGRRTYPTLSRVLLELGARGGVLAAYRSCRQRVRRLRFVAEEPEKATAADCSCQCAHAEALGTSRSGLVELPRLSSGLLSEQCANSPVDVGINEGAFTRQQTTRADDALTGLEPRLVQALDRVSIALAMTAMAKVGASTTFSMTTNRFRNLPHLGSSHLGLAVVGRLRRGCPVSDQANDHCACRLSALLRRPEPPTPDGWAKARGA